MSDTSSGSPRSNAKSNAKRGAKASAKKNAGRREVLAGEGVLANLPRTRPQRSSARRDAARRDAGSAAATVTTPAREPRSAAPAKAQPHPAPKPTPAKRAPAKAKTGPAAKPKAAPRAKAKVRPKKAAGRAPAAGRAQDPVPRQGFETEGDPVSGPVQPPGGVDLLSSAAELAGELTKSGLSSGGRLLKDFLARLPLN
jgi:hypothetical protein